MSTQVVGYDALRYSKSVLGEDHIIQGGNVQKYIPISFTMYVIRTGKNQEISRKLVEKVFPKIEQGEIKPTIYAVLPITEAEAAHDILYKGQNVGKVVLTVE